MWWVVVIPWTELSDDSPDVVRQKSKDYQESRTNLWR